MPQMITRRRPFRLAIFSWPFEMTRSEQAFAQCDDCFQGASAHSQCPSSQEDFRVVFHRTADHVSSLATHVSDTLTDRNVFGRIYLENHGKLFFGFFVVLLRVEDVSHLKKSQLGMCFLRWATRP